VKSGELVEGAAVVDPAETQSASGFWVNPKNTSALTGNAERAAKSANEGAVPVGRTRKKSALRIKQNWD